MDADIFAIQETKLQAPQITDEMKDVEGYNAFWSHATVKKGYSGVCTYTRIKPKRINHGIGEAKFDNEGTKTDNARLTIVHNGVTIHDNRVLPGPTGGALDNNESAPGGIYLQDHSNPVQYRNIWIVEK